MAWVEPEGLPSLPMIETVGREAIVKGWGGLEPVNKKKENQSQYFCNI
jgi:hypothetical protein